MEAIFLLLWIFIAVGAGKIAAEKGLDGRLFFGLTLLLGLIGLVIAMLISREREAAEPQEAAMLPRDEPHKRCPQCAEMIKAAALKCRFCGANVSGAPDSVTPLEALVATIKQAGYTVEQRGSVWNLHTASGGCTYHFYNEADLRRWADGRMPAA